MEILEYEKMTKLISKLDSLNQQNIGARNSLLKELKEEYKIKNVKDAEIFLKDIKQEMENLEEEINDNIQELKMELKKEGLL
jgi:phenylalanyl-tRNA synthetase alpha subunit